MAHEATDQNFKNDVLEADKPVLVDFWAEWCGPCRQLSPVVEELSREMADRIKVYKMNVDKNPETPSKYGIRGIPTLILFRNGKPVGTKVGSLPKAVIQKWIDDQIVV